LWSFGGKKQTAPLEVQVEEAKEEEKKTEEKKRVMAKVKSLTNLERLYMIDILEKGKKEIELVMHFVNKQFNPTMSPVIKRYRMYLDNETQSFLVNLQREISTTSHLVSKVANAHFQLNNPASASTSSGFQQHPQL